MDDNNQAKKATLMMTMAKKVNFGETGFHPFVFVVGYISKPVRIIRLCRFPLVPTYKIRKAGANVQIRPFLLILSASNIVLQENIRSSLILAREHESSTQQLNPVGQRLPRFLFK